MSQGFRLETKPFREHPLIPSVLGGRGSRGFFGRSPRSSLQDGGVAKGSCQVVIVTDLIHVIGNLSTSVLPRWQNPEGCSPKMSSVR